MFLAGGERDRTAYRRHRVYHSGLRRGHRRRLGGTHTPGDAVSKRSRLRHTLAARREDASEDFGGTEGEGWQISHRPRRKTEHPATSESAHEAIRPRKATDKQRILSLLAGLSPCAGRTRKELALRLGISENTVNGRVAELRAERSVEVQGTRARCGIVWYRVN